MPVRLINDYRFPGFFISTNVSLFGNIIRKDSNTWNYFIKSRSAAPPPMGKIFNELLTHFVATPEQKAHLIAVLLFLTQTIKTAEGILYQIFVPRDIVDNVAFLSRARAVPWDTSIHKPTFDKKRNRHTKIAPILDIYRSHPRKLASIMDSMEARIMPRKEFFADPKSGIKIFAYSTLDKKREETYMKRLKIIADWIYQSYLKRQ